MMPSGPVLGDAILRLQPNAAFHLQNEDLDTLEWLDDSIVCPTTEEILSTFELLKIEFENQLYRRNRKNMYPSIGDQLDDLFKAGLFSAEMSAKIQSVKDLYPKPEELI